MHSPSAPPRQVTIGAAASFVGTTQRAIRHYHEIGLLPEPGRGRDARRRYGYDDLVRLLWIRRMADAGIALDDIRDAFGDTQSSRMGVLSDVVAGRLEGLPEGSLRQADLDDLLVTERSFGPLGAAVRASRFIALATHPDLREESDRLDAAEEALDDTVAVDDPRVAQVAAARHAVEKALDAVIEDSGLAESEDALFDSWDALHPSTHPETAEAGEGAPGHGPGSGQASMSAFEAVGKLPYDLSPARLRCLELVEELAARESPAT